MVIIISQLLMGHKKVVFVVDRFLKGGDLKGKRSEMKREELRKTLQELEAKIRNRLVLPKTILSEMQKLSGKTENALLSIEGLVEDVREVRRRFEEIGGDNNDARDDGSV